MKGTLVMQLANAKREFVQFCRTLYDRELVTGVGGNVAVRHADRVLVTPTGRSLGHLVPEDVVSVDLEGQPTDGGQPSKEAAMHLAIIRARPEANVVCHVHGPYIIAASCMLEPGADSLPPLTPGYVFYAYPMPMLPFAVPGSPELCDQVAEQVGEHRAVLLQNHGLVTYGETAEEALNIAEEVDEAARVYVVSGGRARPIPPDLRKKIF